MTLLRRQECRERTYGRVGFVFGRSHPNDVVDLNRSKVTNPASNVETSRICTSNVGFPRTKTAWPVSTSVNSHLRAPAITRAYFSERWLDRACETWAELFAFWHSIDAEDDLYHRASNAAVSQTDPAISDMALT